MGEKLGDAVQTGTALAAVTCMPDGKVRLTLTRDSMVFDECYDRVILALPFSILRQLDIARAGFRPLKHQNQIVGGHRHGFDQSEAVAKRQLLDIGDVALGAHAAFTELANRKGLSFNQCDTESFRAKLREAGFYKEWKQKFGPEAWGHLESVVGTLA